MSIILVLVIITIALLTGLITSFVSAATVGMGKKIIKEGSSNLDFAWKCGRKYFIKIFLTSLIIGIIFFVLFIPLLLGLILTNTILAIIGAIILILLGIILFLGVMVVGQSIVVGERAVIEAIKESFHLFWNNKLTIFLVGVINFIISLVLGIALGLILGLIPVLGSALSSIITNLILTPLFALVTTYLYLDLKGKEAFLENQKKHVVENDFYN